MKLRTVEAACIAALSCAILPAAESAAGDCLFRAVCATCHGTAGEGIPRLLAPSIGGLPTWYVELQLKKFRLGYRGLPPDHAGAAMRSIALAIPAASLPSLATHVASLPPHPTQGNPPGDLARAAAYFLEACAPCHRYNGHGERAFHSAPITLLPTWYIEASLRKFRARVRGGHPRDEPGGKMQAVTAHLSDQMIRELASYLSVLAKTHPPGERRAQQGFQDHVQQP